MAYGASLLRYLATYSRFELGTCARALFLLRITPVATIKMLITCSLSRDANIAEEADS